MTTKWNQIKDSLGVITPDSRHFKEGFLDSKFKVLKKQNQLYVLLVLDVTYI